MASAPPILVTGANGFIGSHLVDRLLARGRRVRVLIRARSRTDWLDPAAEIVFGDVRRALSLPPAVAGVEVVYHVAGALAQRRERTYQLVNGEGTRSLVLACRKAGVRRFVLVSSMAAVGPARNGRPVRESDTPRPVSAYGRSKLFGERATLEEAGPVEVVVLRPPVIYGPRDRGILTIFQLVCAGLSPAFRPEKYFSILHVSDLVDALLLAGESPGASGQTFHVANPTAPSLTELLELVARHVGVRPRRLPVSGPLLRLAAGVVDAIAPSLPLPVRPLRDKVREFLEDHWILDTERARRRLGFRPRVSLDEGFAETAEFYRRRGWLRSASDRMRISAVDPADGGWR